MSKRLKQKMYTLRGLTVSLIFPARLLISFSFPLNFLCLSHLAPLHSIPPSTTYMRSTFYKKKTTYTCTFLLFQTNIFEIYHHYLKIVPFIIIGAYFLFFKLFSFCDIVQVDDNFMNLVRFITAPFIYRVFLFASWGWIWESGFKGQGLGRGRALLTGQTGFGVWSVGFVLRTAAKIVIHLLYQVGFFVYKLS